MNFTEREMERIFDELTPVDVDQLYNDFLDETNAMVMIGNLEYYPSRVFKEVDPIAYNCGFSEWLDFELGDDRLVEVEDNYYSVEEVNELLEQEDQEDEKE